MERKSAAARLFIPMLAPLYELIGPLADAAIRLVVGLMLVPFGWAKLSTATRMGAEIALFHKLGIEPAVPLAWFIVLLEFFGGIALALGLLTHPLAFAVAVEMLVITFAVMIPEGRPYQLTLMWGIIAFAIAWRGGGRYSIDRLIGREF